MVSAGARSKDYDKSRYISILNIIQVGWADWADSVTFCCCSAVHMKQLRPHVSILGIPRMDPLATVMPLADV